MDNRVIDQQAYLIHRKDYRNNSLILELFTQDFGRVSLLARGAKNSKTPAKFQPFQLLQVSWVGATELKTLTSLDAGRQIIEHQLYFAALYVSELLLLFLPKGENSELLFKSYQQFLLQLTEQTIQSQLRTFETKLMLFSGLMPDISCDAISYEPIQANKFYQFYPDSGFVKSNNNENIFSGEAILKWLEQDFDNNAVKNLARVIMRSIIDFNLNGKRLKSRDIYQQLKNS